MFRYKILHKSRYLFAVASRNRLRGFSLVELLVVIAIISLLLAILMPALSKTKSIAMRLKCVHNLKQINIAMQLYVDGNDNTYPCTNDPLPPGYWLWMGRGWRGFVEPYLGGNIDANNPSVLYCPRDRISKEQYDSTSYAYSMAFYHTPQQIDDMNDFSDTWSNAQPGIPQRGFSVAHPSAKILIGEWHSNHLPAEGNPGWWSWLGRRNYLFADGNVIYLKAKQIRQANDGWPDVNLTVHGIKGIDYQP